MIGFSYTDRQLNFTTSKLQTLHKTAL